MRIWVRPATKIIMPPSDFQGPTRVFRTPQEGWCFTEAIPLSPDNPIPGVVSAPYKEKKTLPGTQADVSEFGCVTALSSAQTRTTAAHTEAHTLTAQPNACLSPWAGSGILTRFPFAPGGCQLREKHRYTHMQGTPRLCTETPDRLGPPDPWPTAVPMEPFSTSAFKVLT